MNTNDVLNWVKEFKYSWLPNHINNNTELIELISDKVYELEQLLDTNHEYHSDSSLVLTSLDNHQTINDENESFSYPAIRIKRISLAEARRFLPPGWDTPKAQPRRKRGRKKSSLTLTNRKRKRNLLSQTYDESAFVSCEFRPCSVRSPSTVSSEIPAINENKPKQKRKLRAIDAEDDDLYTLGNLSQTETSIDDCEQIPRYIGQNGILSQTRKTNETTTTTTTFDDDDDNTHNSTMKLFSNIISSTTAASANDDISIAEEPSINNNNNNSIMNYDVCVEDITNDGIDAPAPPNQFEQFSLTT